MEDIICNQQRRIVSVPWKGHIGSYLLMEGVHWHTVHDWVEKRTFFTDLAGNIFSPSPNAIEEVCVSETLVAHGSTGTKKNDRSVPLQFLAIHFDLGGMIVRNFVPLE
mmetsp:Transcript_15582/g.33753  ORF Transcript_15582/g.33753 Transcript_15582/m.33753 type:complete len:108 (+) Transcript_15582:71-394(+)|eukprot:CAMPEP_0172327404 /NCGR_PEP_ID=MMETSP1058-20130122/59483_1 /TAXON_ID=83371 /ORGANISM="Detonula confervacea, Strain CCMP 353" /LENGTH=107 /DNA_ID=CAMNT_0013044441 /DNA_START=69 /DNA_END=392 /DNA_ORIENTATION=-